MRKYLLVYDADCGPCTRFKRVVKFLDSYGKFDFESLIRADEEGLLDAISKPKRYSSFHIVSPDGTAVSGAQAIPTLVDQLPFGRPVSRFVTSAPGGVRAIGFIYGVFSRLHDTGSCEYRPGQGPPREQPVELKSGAVRFESHLRGDQTLTRGYALVGPARTATGIC